MEAYLLKMVVSSALLFGYYRLVLYNESFHQWNRFYLLAVTIVSIVAPLLTIPVEPVSSTTRLPDLSGYLITSNNSSQQQRLIDLSVVFQLVIVVVAVYLLFRMTVGLLQLLKVQRNNPSTYINSKVQLIFTSLNNAPFSFFNWLFWRRDIDLSSASGRRMLEHEMAHIKQHHSIDKMLMSAVLCVFWINPFFWLIRRELSIIHEFLADKKAIDQKDGTAFAQMILLAMGQGNTNSNTLVNPFFSSQIKRRLQMITTSKQPRYSYMRRITGLCFMVCLGTFLAISIQQAEAQEAKPAAPKKEKQPLRVEKIIKQKEAKAVKVPEPATPAKPGIPAKPTHAKPEVPAVPAIPSKPDDNFLPSSEQPLYIVDGKEVSATTVHSLNPSSIEELKVLKEAAAAEKYGQRGKHGVIEIKLKSAEAKPVKKPLDEAAFYVNNEPSTKEEVELIDKNEIESVNVIKGEHATKKYGEKGKNGVIEIRLKKKAN